MKNKKDVFKIWGIILGLSVGTYFAGIYFGKDGTMILRLLTVVFFCYLLARAKKIIKSYKPMVDAGYTEHLFNPNYLFITLWLVIIGLSIGLVMDYAELPVWWMLPYMLGVVIIPLTTGVIPFRKKDNRFRGK